MQRTTFDRGFAPLPAAGWTLGYLQTALSTAFADRPPVRWRQQVGTRLVAGPAAPSAGLATIAFPDSVHVIEFAPVVFALIELAVLEPTALVAVLCVSAELADSVAEPTALGLVASECAGPAQVALVDSAQVAVVDLAQVDPVPVALVDLVQVALVDPGKAAFVVPVLAIADIATAVPDSAPSVPVACHRLVLVAHVESEACAESLLGLVAAEFAVLAPTEVLDDAAFGDVVALAEPEDASAVACDCSQLAAELEAVPAGILATEPASDPHSAAASA